MPPAGSPPQSHGSGPQPSTRFECPAKRGSAEGGSQRSKAGTQWRMLGFSLVERLVEFIQPAFLVAGYAIVAGAVLLERSILLGLIIPGDIILALGGVYAARGQLNVVLVIVIGSLAAIAGESIGYWLGRKYGLRLIRR